MNWTDPAIKAEVRQLWVDKGLSAGQIAIHYKDHKVTRNAVIGVIRRLGLLRANAAQKTIARVPIRRPRRTAAESMTPLERVFAEPVAVEPQEKEIIPMRRVSFDDLEDGDCRFIDEDSVGPHHLFCGCKKEPGLPYCRAHCRVAFAVPSPRRSGVKKLVEAAEKEHQI